MGSSAKKDARQVCVPGLAMLFLTASRAPLKRRPPDNGFHLPLPAHCCVIRDHRVSSMHDDKWQ